MDMRVIGVDGCHGGWVAVALRDGSFDSAFAADQILVILSHFEGARAVAIDIPIGAQRGRFRQVDAAAKELLGSRGSTLFETPPLEVLACPDFESALALCRQLTGKGFSKQSYALRGRILEVDAVAKRDRAADDRGMVHGAAPRAAADGHSRGFVRPASPVGRPGPRRVADLRSRSRS